MTTFRVLEPDEWGMRWANPPVTERLGDPETFWHHRAGNPRHTTDAEVVFREMNEAAIAIRGYSATHYDILVHEHTPSDTITIGIARGAYRSAATLDRNEEGEAICAIGYFHPGHSLSERPSPGMVEGMIRATLISIERGWSAPDTLLLGHRDNPAHPDDTGCPGDYFYELLPWARQEIARRLNPTTPPPPPPPPGGNMPKFIDVDTWRAFEQGDRVYDSRLSEPGYRNPNVRKGRLSRVTAKNPPLQIATGQIARIAEIRVTALNADAPGFIVAGGRPNVGIVPLVNYEPGRVSDGTVTLGLPDGHVYLWTPHGPVDVIVDVFGIGL